MISSADMLAQLKNVEELLQYEKTLKNCIQSELNSEKLVHKIDNQNFIETIKNLTEKLSNAEKEIERLNSLLVCSSISGI